MMQTFLRFLRLVFIAQLTKQMYSKTQRVKLIFVSCIAVVLYACTPSNQTTASEKVATNQQVVTSDVKELSRQIESSPENPELYYKRSVVYFQDKYLDLALADITESTRLDSLMPLYHYHKGRVEYAMNKTVSAEQSYLKAIAIKPDYEEAKMKLAELYYIVKMHPKSIELVNAVINQNKKNANAYFLRGMNQKETGDTARAIASFQKCIEVDADFYDAAMQLGIILTARRSKTAYDYLTAAIRMQPRNTEAYFARAYYSQMVNRFQDALIDYKKVIDLDPSNADAYYNVGYINFQAKQYKEALRAWNICVQMNNEYTEAYYMRGLLHEIQGNKTDARVNYEFALKLDPTYELAQKGLENLK